MTGYADPGYIVPTILQIGTQSSGHRRSVSTPSATCAHCGSAIANVKLKKGDRSESLAASTELPARYCHRNFRPHWVVQQVIVLGHAISSSERIKSGVWRIGNISWRISSTL